MPLLPEPTTQELEDHFFGAGGLDFGWFMVQWISDDGLPHFPAKVSELDYDGVPIYPPHMFDEVEFIRGIKKLAEILPDRTYQDLLEDMDAVDVDNAIQLAMFGEIRYA